MDMSLIIPVHNLEHYIQILLSSLYNQTFDNIEVEYIFVLDACTDNTKKIIEDWKTSITNATITLYEVDYKSCGLSRNYGMEHSTGKYLWFVDGDDMILEQDAIKELYNTIKSCDHPVIRFKFLSNWYSHMTNAEKIDWIMIWQYVFDRDFIGSLRFEKVQPNEDKIFMIQIFQKLKEKFGKPELLYIQRPFYFYNYNRAGSNMSIFKSKEQ